VACAACTGEDTRQQFEWDDRRVLCSIDVDDVKREPGWDRIEAALHTAHDHASVALLHAHVPGATVSTAALERVFGLADQLGLASVTFSELREGAPAKAGLAFSFDDRAAEEWYGVHDLLDAHHVHATFFVTRYAEWTDSERMRLAELAASGHDVQAHSVSHANAVDYAAEHGVAAYVTDEALPSIAVLQADGYEINSYAFPYGASTDELDDAMLEHVAFVRVGLATCPYDR
jgi:hypothetical protein